MMNRWIATILQLTKIYVFSVFQSLSGLLELFQSIHRNYSSRSSSSSLQSPFSDLWLLHLQVSTLVLHFQDLYRSSKESTTLQILIDKLCLKSEPVSQLKDLLQFPQPCLGNSCSASLLYIFLVMSSLAYIKCAYLNMFFAIIGV